MRFFIISLALSVILVVTSAELLSSGECGKAKIPLPPSNRIINGANAVKGAWPWMGSMRKFRANGNGTGHSCGCSIIDDYFILTAAHCVDSSPHPSNFMIVLGDYDTSVNETEERWYTVSEAIMHPEYNSERIVNDIAILMLHEPADFTSPYISRSCLPDKVDYPTDHQDITIIGWGYTVPPRNVTPTILQIGKVASITDEECAAKWTQTYVPEAMICTWDATQATCNGDSGGPNMIQESDGRYVQVGATSFGHSSSCLSEWPKVFTRVPTYMPWIRSLVEDLNCGVSKATPYVIGGAAAGPGVYPWMASIQLVGWDHLCGATVVDDLWVLTAAHCFAKTTSDVTRFNVRVGTHDLGPINFQGEVHSVAKIIMHPSFRALGSGFYDGDIALVKLTKPIDFTKRIGRVCLSAKSDNPDGVVTNAAILGFGDKSDSTGNMMPSTLQETSGFNVKTSASCQTAFGSSKFNANTMICAESASKTCIGDEGGPLFMTSASGHAVQIGVVSKPSCGMTGNPGVFTRVSAYLDWIRSAIYFA